MDIGVNRLSLVACGTEIDDLDDGTLEVLEQNILGFEIAMDQSGLVEQREAI